MNKNLSTQAMATKRAAIAVQAGPAAAAAHARREAKLRAMAQANRGK